MILGRAQRGFEEDQGRGKLMLDFLSRHVTEFNNARVLDVGMGKGGIALALSSRTGVVIGIDASLQGCRYLAAANREGAPHGAYVSVIRGAAERLPFADSRFDLVLMNGVLEWVGRDSANPREGQRLALSEVKRVLRPGGFFYLAIENRLFPAFLLMDPHTHQPLVNLLPRALARAATKSFAGRPFGNYIYSWWGLERLLSPFFAERSYFLPMPHYHWPYAFVNFDISAEIRQKAKHLAATRSLPFRYKTTLMYDTLISSFRLNRWLLPYFVVMSRKRMG